jgi:arsenate reductase
VLRKHRGKMRHNVTPQSIQIMTPPNTSPNYPPITVYGIKACDTMKKARTWLDEHGIEYHFHDYKVAGIDALRVQAWVRELGWEAVLNRAGTTFRKLPEAEKVGLTEQKAIELMLAQPSMIKRPVLDAGGRLLVGFKPETYTKLLSSGS